MSSKRKSKSSIFEFSAFLLLALLVLVIPFPKAGMVAWMAPVLIGVGVLLFACMSAHKVFYTDIDIQHEMAWFAPLIVMIVWVSLQLLVFPSVFGWYAIFDSEEIKGTFFEDFTGPVDLITSIQWMGYFFTYWCIVWVASNIQWRYVERLMWLVVITSLIVASYALISYLGKHETIFGVWDKEHYLSYATGSFVNRNHLANFLAICIPIALTLLLSRRFDSLKSQLTIPLLILYVIIVLSAVISTQSRMGGVVFVLGVVLWVSFEFISSGKTSSAIKGSLYKRLVLAIFALLFIVWMFWFGFTETFERFLTPSLGNAREEFRSIMYSMPVKSWLLGIQPGVFSDIYSYYAPVDFNFRLNHAHNDYLEFILEIGVLGCILFLISLRALICKTIFNLSERFRGALFAVVVVMAAHSLVDFSLHIPANAVYFWLIVGVAFNSTLISVDMKEPRKDIVKVLEGAQKDNKAEQTHQNKVTLTVERKQSE